MFSAAGDDEASPWRFHFVAGGAGADAMIHLYALDLVGSVIAKTGTAWVRDTFW